MGKNKNINNSKSRIDHQEFDHKIQNSRKTTSQEIVNVLSKDLKNPRIANMISNNIKKLEEIGTYSEIEQRAKNFFDEAIDKKNVLFFIGKELYEDIGGKERKETIVNILSSDQYKQEIKTSFLDQYKVLFIKKIKDLYSKNKKSFLKNIIKFSDYFFSNIQIGYESELGHDIRGILNIDEPFIHKKIKEKADANKPKILLSASQDKIETDLKNIINFFENNNFSFLSKTNFKKEFQTLFKDPLHRKILFHELQKEQTLIPINKGNDIYSLEIHQRLGRRMILEKDHEENFIIHGIYTDHDRYEERLKYLNANRKIPLAKRKINLDSLH